ncbi:uncharacterized protein LOC124368997 isoform X2 [Homalodisca vitripennis]|uniref:uncharacterized protein LOC124368997 isoform X2 n=1 Tax=Homalodisca vitripennis TaxID=197043 RepID=UPI001EEC3FBC|nr:uncharacterized protein LOC124368997 isoform X2 [Homalodisca vitripennis]
MFSVSFAVTLGFLATTSFLKTSRALPLPTTPLPPLPRRFIEPPFEKPFEKDLFKDGYSVDYPDVPKRPNIAQQAHENVKKVPRSWGPLSNEIYESNFYGQPQPRGIIDTNSIQQDFGDAFKKNYVNNFEVEGYYLDEDLSTEEEESNFIEPSYPAEPTLVNAYFGIEPQLNYVSDQYQFQTTTYSTYSGDDTTSADYNVSEETHELDNDSSCEETDEDYNNDTDLTPPIVTNSVGTKGPTKVPQVKSGEQFQQVLSALNKVLNSDSDINDSESKPKIQRPTKKFVRPIMNPSEGKSRSKPIVNEDPIIEKTPAPKEVFSRTTTITKTTTWYLNEDNEVMVIEDIDGMRNPLKGKYTKTSKTTTSGPVPCYLQGLEDVIFEEENEKKKSKTILDKMSYLKGMNPTSITSFTTAPNPWSTEVHEEVVFEEIIKMKDVGTHAESKTHYLGSQPSPMEHIVDYLPRKHSVIEEDVEEVKEVEQVIIEKEEEEIVVEASLDFQPYQVPIPSPKQYVPPVQFQPVYSTTHPQQSIEAESTAEDRNYLENPYMNDLLSGQITTPKPLSTPPTIDNTFTPHPTVGPHPSLDPTHPPTPSTQSPYNLPQPLSGQHPQLYGNHPQPQNWDHSGQANRRDKWEQQNNWDNYQDPQHPQVKNEVLPLIQEEPVRHHPSRMEQEGKRQLTPQEAKRQLYQNRQQFQNRQGRTRDL